MCHRRHLDQPRLRRALRGAPRRPRRHARDRGHPGVLHLLPALDPRPAPARVTTTAHPAPSPPSRTGRPRRWSPATGGSGPPPGWSCSSWPPSRPSSCCARASSTPGRTRSRPEASPSRCPTTGASASTAWRSRAARGACTSTSWARRRSRASRGSSASATGSSRSSIAPGPAGQHSLVFDVPQVPGDGTTAGRFCLTPRGGPVALGGMLDIQADQVAPTLAGIEVPTRVGVWFARRPTSAARSSRCCPTSPSAPRCSAPGVGGAVDVLGRDAAAHAARGLRVGPPARPHPRRRAAARARGARRGARGARQRRGVRHLHPRLPDAGRARSRGVRPDPRRDRPPPVGRRRPRRLLAGRGRRPGRHPRVLHGRAVRRAAAVAGGRPRPLAGDGLQAARPRRGRRPDHRRVAPARLLPHGRAGLSRGARQRVLRVAVGDADRVRAARRAHRGLHRAVHPRARARASPPAPRCSAGCSSPACRSSRSCPARSTTTRGSRRSRRSRCG